MTMHALASHRVGVIQGNDRCAADDLGFGREGAGRLGDPLDVGRRRRVRLGDDDDVGHAQDGLARMMGGLMSRPQRIDENDVEARSDERKVVVAAVPQDDIRLLLGSLEDAGIVGTGKDQVADGEMRLVLLALLDRCTARHRDRRGSRTAARPGARGCRRASDGGRTTTRRPRSLRRRDEPAGHLRLADAGSHRRDRDDGDARLQHGALRSKQG